VSRPATWLAAAAAATLLLAAPALWPSSYAAGVLVTLALSLTLALAFDLMAGHLGAVSLAAPAFYAVGAYTAGILATRYGTGFLANLLAAAVLAAGLAVAVGWPLFRLSDLAFAIGSLGLGLIAAALANNLTDLTGGAMCTTGVAAAELRVGPLVLSTATPAAAWYLALGLAGLAALVYLALTTGRGGRALHMVQGDEHLAASFGVSALGQKLLAFAASGALTAAAGVFYAHYTTVVCPADFSPLLTLNLLVIVFVGGAGRLAGVLLGAILFVAVSEWARGFQHWSNLVYGAMLLGAVLVLPRGLAGLWARRP
jgi:ABC-type branched-subunit amino acid transport system permease subunit